MASQALPRTLQPPPDLPPDAKVSDTLAQYLRTFSLWCRHGFADKLSISTATPQLMMQTEDVPPAVYQLKVTSDPTLTLTPVALGTGDLGTPVTLTVSTDLDAYMPKSGGTFTGQITAPGISAPQAMSDNRIINGDMRIDQRNAGASGTASAYTVDRWQYGATQTNKITWQQSGASCPGFPYALKLTVSAAFAVAAGDTFYAYQPIEADMLADLGWGSSGVQPQPVTLSFWVFSSLTGTFAGAIQNGASTRSYPFTFSIPSASTWVRVVVTIPADTSGTWVLSGNAAGMFVFFDLGSGANFRAAAGAWGAGNRVGATGAVNLVATNGALFYLTGVKLEIGSVVTPYNRQSLTKSLADCQRYYQTGVNVYSGYGVSTAVIYNTQLLGIAMRATPAIAFSGISLSNTSALTLNAAGVNFVSVFCSITTTGGGSASFSFAASAEL